MPVWNSCDSPPTLRVAVADVYIFLVENVMGVGGGRGVILNLQIGVKVTKDLHS